MPATVATSPTHLGIQVQYVCHATQETTPAANNNPLPHQLASRASPSQAVSTWLTDGRDQSLASLPRRLAANQPCAAAVIRTGARIAQTMPAPNWRRGRCHGSRKMQ